MELSLNNAFESLLHWATISIEIAGILVIVIGVLRFSVRYLIDYRRQHADAYHRFRSGLGRSILLGLEFLVAADIIATVSVHPTVNSVLVLGGIVLIRTFLSMALEVEINGHFPWQANQTSKNENTSK